ncbi:hypothetical protein [Mycobacterium sp. NPDC050853]|uniref:hypothetical protein n=1 Tax=Mycobacterium sp. NPDC050853 TaxID=3155160 RepID=UPI0033E1FAC5
MGLDWALSMGGGVAMRSQLLEVLGRRGLDEAVANRKVIRQYRGVYTAPEPGIAVRLKALDLFIGEKAVACMFTAAALHGFDTERPEELHVYDLGRRLRPTPNLVVHQRDGAPLSKLDGRLMSTAPWTAIECARAIRRGRALGVLDAVLRSRLCSVADLARAADVQRGRRGIVRVRELLPLADGRAESAMESESRLVMIDGGLPLPELQFEIFDRCGELWRVDFAWPDIRLAAEYDSIEWHASREGMLRDKMRTARLQECGWTIVPITVEDVRRDPIGLVARIRHHLSVARKAG